MLIKAVESELHKAVESELHKAVESELHIWNVFNYLVVAYISFYFNYFHHISYFVLTVTEIMQLWRNPNEAGIL